ncbi:hypothetical protein BDY19DRAFT_927283 [Irpex rosettiformis]|uniref:Uncharacterized protein n=1 Tax=Irpex rosettiformis TaxID=378272 RepID=A0ACB8UCC1_9APHY|nr:hypothetical protein BDY19DRAFT_927283 [Irpex rosettiformis]
MASSILEHASQEFHDRLRHSLGNTNKPVFSSNTLTPEFAVGEGRELDIGFNDLLRCANCIIDQLVESIQNPVQVDWSVADYWAGFGQYAREAEHPPESWLSSEPWRRAFPPKWKNSRLIEEATLFVDKEGRILCWFLPNVLAPELQVCRQK